MTCIAYRAGVIACDTLCSIGGTKIQERKIVERKGYLFGMAGSNCPNLDAAANWFLQNLALVAKSRLPSFSKDTTYEFTMMVITPKGKILLVEDHGGIDVIRDKFFAIGSGDAPALAAMGVGADAATAVKMAIRYADGCGGKVLTRKLKNTK